MDVEEFEIKQRSLASVKRARLKEKKNLKPGDDIKKEFKKVIRDVKIPKQITIQELLIEWQNNLQILSSFF